MAKEVTKTKKVKKEKPIDNEYYGNLQAPKLSFKIASEQDNIYEIEFLDEMGDLKF